MPESKRKKLGESLMKIQTSIAKALGTKRIGAPKTEKMSEKMLANYKTQCENFIEWAKVAKQIEDAAIAGKLKEVAGNARSCKIAIKSYYEKFVKDAGGTEADYTLDSRHLDKATGEIKELLANPKHPLEEMTTIYNTAVATYTKLSGQTDLKAIQPPPVPSAPPKL